MNSKSLVEVTKALLQQDTVKKSLDFICGILESLGFSCTYLKFQDVFNLFAVHKNYCDKSKIISFMGHVDVVPACGGWSYEPFSATLVDDKIFGRGAVDMKGGIACFISALSELEKTDGFSKIPESVVFFISGDEEGNGEFGTKAMMKFLQDSNKLPKIDFCLIGEPTSNEFVGDNIKIGCRGSLNVAVRAKGKAGHVAYFEKAVNPINPMLEFLIELKNMQFDEGAEFFGKTNLEITNIDVGNAACNVIPDEVTANFNIRFNNEQTADKIIEIIQNLSKNYDKIIWDFRYDRACEPFLSEEFSANPPVNSPVLSSLIDACKDITNGKNVSVSAHGANSDAKFIKDLFPFAELGLKTEQAHQINEFTTTKDLESLKNIYKQFLVKVLGAPS